MLLSTPAAASPPPRVEQFVSDRASATAAAALAATLLRWLMDMAVLLGTQGDHERFVGGVIGFRGRSFGGRGPQAGAGSEAAARLRSGRSDRSERPCLSTTTATSAP
ncbi:hypothetical protein GCM10009527_086590 [Actinomadura nitritigenes]